MQYRRILVTGASGLLGRAVATRLAEEGAVLRLGHRQAGEGAYALDLTGPDAFAQLESMEWDAVVHCAAYRSPDFCEEHRDAARLLNALVPARLATLARRRGARLIHISTDYVFPGTHPPYHEDDACGPVNYYGETKLEAERGVAATAPGAVILRIGALYGRPTRVAGSPMLEEALRAIYSPRKAELDDRIMRYPLFTGDVAEVVRFLLEQPAVTGVIHVGAQMGVTRYRWTRFVADCLGVTGATLEPASRDLSRSAKRPLDACLAVDRLRALGGPLPRDADKVLPWLLAECRGWVEAVAASAALG